MSTEPPGDKSDRSSSSPWLSPGDDQRSVERGASPARRSRLVGSVVDPGAENDGLGLTGPGAPSSPFGGKGEHPVRARLLERARQGDSSEIPFLPATADPPKLERAAPPPIEVAEPAQHSSPIAIRTPAPVSEENPPTGTPIVEVGFPPSEPGSRTPPPGAVMSELDRIARRRPTARTGPGLSPNLIAVLGGLVGLTVITTLGVFLSKTEVALDASVEEKPVVAPPAEKRAEPPVELPKRQKVPGPWRVMDDAAKAGHSIIQGRIGKNAFLTAIQEAGLPKSEAYRAYNSLKDLKDLDRCKSADTFVAVVRGAEKSLVGFEYIVSKEEVYQAKANEQGQLEGKKLDLKVERNQIRRALAYDGKSFEESARRAGFDPGLATVAEEALRGHFSLSEFKKGDRLRIIAQEVTVLGEFSRYAGVEAIEILRPGQEPLRVYYYSHPVEGGYFDAQGKAPYEGGWRKPIPGAPVTSKFDMKRLHPVLKKVMPHNGTDFGAPTGTPIGATAPGKVSYIGYAGPSGNLVKVNHEGGYESGYAHLSRYAEGLKVGDSVDRLQTVGYCGSTGRSTGPHLHFTMKKDDKFIDPESLNLDGMRVLPKAHREEFALVGAKYDPILSAIPLPAAPTPEPEAAPMAEPEQGDEGTEESPEAEAFGMMPGEPTSLSDDVKAAPAPQAAPSPSPAASAPAKPSAPVKPAKAENPSAIFLSDADLLKMQAASDDGEVAE